MKALIALVGLVAAACIPTQPDVTGGPPLPTPTPGVSATAAGEVQMCTLMPLAVVLAKSPFQTPLSQFKAGVDPGMCTYRSADDATDPVSILLEITAFSKASDARTSLANARQAAVDAGLPVADINGLGDAAFSSGSDEVGVHTRVDNRVIDANLKGEWPDTTDDAKVVAGTALLRTILSRLP